MWGILYRVTNQRLMSYGRLRVLVDDTLNPITGSRDEMENLMKLMFSESQGRLIPVESAERMNAKRWGYIYIPRRGDGDYVAGKRIRDR